MSYDVYMAVDTGGSEPHYIEPFYDDIHPGIGRDSGGMTAVATASGYARCGNYTRNVSGMWTKCLSATATVEQMQWAGDAARAFNAEGRTAHWRDGAGGWHRNEPLPVDSEHLTLRDLNGKTGEELAPLLRAAVAWGVASLEELHEDDPSNGWGDADGAVTFLWDIQRMCEEHPKARLYVSS